MLTLLSRIQADFYPTWQEAADAAKKLGITSLRMYRSGVYKKDPRLPSVPHSYKDFPGYRIFFRGVKLAASWARASKIAVALSIVSKKEYYARYKEDLRLPGEPRNAYKDFPGWSVFLCLEEKRASGRRDRDFFYDTWQEASAAAKKLKIESRAQLEKRYKEDPRLPSNPKSFYKDFPGYSVFFRK